MSFRKLYIKKKIQTRRELLKKHLSKVLTLNDKGCFIVHKTLSKVKKSVLEDHGPSMQCFSEDDFDNKL